MRRPTPQKANHLPEFVRQVAAFVDRINRLVGLLRTLARVALAALAFLASTRIALAACAADLRFFLGLAARATTLLGQSRHARKQHQGHNGQCQRFQKCAHFVSPIRDLNESSRSVHPDTPNHRSHSDRRGCGRRVCAAGKSKGHLKHEA